MRVNKLQENNQTTFGIKYTNKRAWNKDVLAAFQNSKLLAKVDEKYPNAKVYYTKFSGEESIANSEILHTLMKDIELEKDKLFRWNLSSHFEKFPEKSLIRELKRLTLKDVEAQAAEKLFPIETIPVNYKRNPIKAFFQKIFS